MDTENAAESSYRNAKLAREKKEPSAKKLVETELELNEEYNNGS